MTKEVKSEDLSNTTLISKHHQVEEDRKAITDARVVELSYSDPEASASDESSMSVSPCGRSQRIVVKKQRKEVNYDNHAPLPPTALLDGLAMADTSDEAIDSHTTFPEDEPSSFPKSVQRGGQCLPDGQTIETVFPHTFQFIPSEIVNECCESQPSLKYPTSDHTTHSENNNKDKEGSDLPIEDPHGESGSSVVSENVELQAQSHITNVTKDYQWATANKHVNDDSSRISPLINVDSSCNSNVSSNFVSREDCCNSLVVLEDAVGSTNDIHQQGEKHPDWKHSETDCDPDIDQQQSNSLSSEVHMGSTRQKQPKELELPNTEFGHAEVDQELQSIFSGELKRSCYADDDVVLNASDPCQAVDSITSDTRPTPSIDSSDQHYQPTYDPVIPTKGPFCVENNDSDLKEDQVEEENHWSTNQDATVDQEGSSECIEYNSGVVTTEEQPAGNPASIVNLELPASFISKDDMDIGSNGVDSRDEQTEREKDIVCLVPIKQDECHPKSFHAHDASECDPEVASSECSYPLVLEQDLQCNEGGLCPRDCDSIKEQRNPKLCNAENDITACGSPESFIGWHQREGPTKEGECRHEDCTEHPNVVVGQGDFDSSDQSCTTEHHQTKLEGTNDKRNINTPEVLDAPRVRGPSQYRQPVATQRERSEELCSSLEEQLYSVPKPDHNGGDHTVFDICKEREGCGFARIPVQNDKGKSCHHDCDDVIIIETSTERGKITHDNCDDVIVVEFSPEKGKSIHHNCDVILIESSSDEENCLTDSKDIIEDVKSDPRQLQDDTLIVNDIPTIANLNIKTETNPVNNISNKENDNDFEGDEDQNSGSCPKGKGYVEMGFSSDQQKIKAEAHSPGDRMENEDSSIVKPVSSLKTETYETPSTTPQFQDDYAAHSRMLADSSCNYPKSNYSVDIKVENQSRPEAQQFKDSYPAEEEAIQQNIKTIFGSTDGLTTPDSEIEPEQNKELQDSITNSDTSDSTLSKNSLYSSYTNQCSTKNRSYQKRVDFVKTVQEAFLGNALNDKNDSSDSTRQTYDTLVSDSCTNTCFEVSTSNDLGSCESIEKASQSECLMSEDMSLETPSLSTSDSSTTICDQQEKIPYDPENASPVKGFPPFCTQSDDMSLGTPSLSGLESDINSGPKSQACDHEQNLQDSSSFDQDSDMSPDTKTLYTSDYPMHLEFSCAESPNEMLWAQQDSQRLASRWRTEDSESDPELFATDSHSAPYSPGKYSPIDVNNTGDEADNENSTGMSSSDGILKKRPSKLISRETSDSSPEKMVKRRKVLPKLTESSNNHDLSSESASSDNVGSNPSDIYSPESFVPIGTSSRDNRNKLTNRKRRRTETRDRGKERGPITKNQGNLSNAIHKRASNNSKESSLKSPITSKTTKFSHINLLSGKSLQNSTVPKMSSGLAGVSVSSEETNSNESASDKELSYDIHDLLDEGHELLERALEEGRCDADNLLNEGQELLEKAFEESVQQKNDDNVKSSSESKEDTNSIPQTGNELSISSTSSSRAVTQKNVGNSWGGTEKSSGPFSFVIEDCKPMAVSVSVSQRKSHDVESNTPEKKVRIDDHPNPGDSPNASTCSSTITFAHKEEPTNDTKDSPNGDEPTSSDALAIKANDSGQTSSQDNSVISLETMTASNISSEGDLWLEPLQNSTLPELPSSKETPETSEDALKIEMSLEDFIDAQLQRNIKQDNASCQKLPTKTEVPSYSMKPIKSSSNRSSAHTISNGGSDRNISVGSQTFLTESQIKTTSKDGSKKTPKTSRGEPSVKPKSNSDIISIPEIQQRTTPSLGVSSEASTPQLRLSEYECKILAILQKRLDVEKAYRVECIATVNSVKDIARRENPTERDLKEILHTRLRRLSQKYVSQLEAFVRSETN